MKKLKLTMTPGHPEWEKFKELLEGPYGCNFRKDDKDETIWNCSSETDRPKAKAILEKMGFSQDAIANSMEYFGNHGGHCDCEILFNVSN